MRIDGGGIWDFGLLDVSIAVLYCGWVNAKYDVGGSVWYGGRLLATCLYRAYTLGQVHAGDSAAETEYEKHWAGKTGDSPYFSGCLSYR